MPRIQIQLFRGIVWYSIGIINSSKERIMISTFTFNGKTYDWEEECAKVMSGVGEVNDISVEGDSVGVEFITLNEFDDCQIWDNVLYTVGTLDQYVLDGLEAYDCVAIHMWDTIHCEVEVAEGNVVCIATLSTESRECIEDCVDSAIEELAIDIRSHINTTERVDMERLSDMTKEELVLAIMDNNESRKAYIRDIYATEGRFDTTMV